MVKLHQLQDFVKSNQLSLNECAIIADGDNDLKTFQAPGNGIVVGSSKAELIEESRYSVNTLSEAIAALLLLDK
jgi:phosphoserine phosphatase